MLVQLLQRLHLEKTIFVNSLHSSLQCPLFKLPLKENGCFPNASVVKEQLKTKYENLLFMGNPVLLTSLMGDTNFHRNYLNLILTILILRSSNSLSAKYTVPLKDYLLKMFKFPEVT